MKIAVVAANGTAGRLIVKEAVERGLDVTAIVRSENKTVAQNVLVKDTFDLTADDLRGYDVVVDALGAFGPQASDIYKATEHLTSVLKGTDVRLLVVGGAGSLYVDDTHTKTVLDTAVGFPEEAIVVVKAHAHALAGLREVSDVKWTYVSPAAEFEAEGARTGEYQLGGDQMLLNAEGKSVISYADYAIAMVDEAESGAHVQQRISVVSK